LDGKYSDNQLTTSINRYLLAVFLWVHLKHMNVNKFRFSRPNTFYLMNDSMGKSQNQHMIPTTVYVHLFRMVCISVVFLLAFSCTNQSKRRFDMDISNLKPDKISLKNYGDALFTADTVYLQSELKRLQPEYYYFLNADLDKSENVKQIRDFVTDNQLIKLYYKTKQAYPDVVTLASQLTDATRRFHYYFPSLPLPEFYTYISGVYRESPVLADQKAIVIGLDCYLGAKEEIYQQMGIPLYASERMTPEHIVNDVFKSIYDIHFSQSAASKTILEEMIQAGKKLYFLEAMQPNMTDELVIGYRKSQLEWAIAHQSDVWAFLVSEQVLYKNDYMMFKKLFGDGPFTQEFSEEAPARLGEWMGWQIVRKFMQNKSETTIAELLQIKDYQYIMTESKYKPKS